MTATAEKPAPKTAKANYASPLALNGKGKPETLKVKDLLRTKGVQARVDVDRVNTEEGTDGTVDEARAEQFAAAMKAGDVFPPVKVVRVAPDEKNKKERLFLFDGLHTHRGAEIARIGEIKCVVWDGTPAQALAAAATVANREHEKNGKPLSNKDKNHSVMMAAKAFEKSDIPKKDWPSNRELAEVVGVSHQMVNNLDPFKRAKPRGEADPTPPPPPAESTLGIDPSPNGPAKHIGGTLYLDPVSKKACSWEVVRMATDEVVARYSEPTATKALDRYVAENAGVKRDHYEGRAIEDAPDPKAKNGSAVNKAFDWAGMESHMGYLVRGHATMGETFALANHAEHLDIKRCLDKMAAYYAETRKKLSKK